MQDPDASHRHDSGQSRKGRVYVAYHKPAPLVAGEGLVPIQVGRHGAAQKLAMIGDDTGAHISDLNPSHCELTAHYWIWRNDPGAEFLGLMHYRRFLDLAARRPARRHPEHYELGFDPAAYARSVATFLDQPDCDIIAAAPTRLRFTLRRQYARCHDVADLNLLEQVVAERRPDFVEDLRRALDDSALRIGNMFIMRRPVFEDYSTLLFDVIGAVHEKLAQQGGARTGYQARYAGFLAERLLTAYLAGPRLHSLYPGLHIRDAVVLNVDPEPVARAGAAQRVKWVMRRQIPLVHAIRAR
ncbi:DUF4422 domain-containing protein [Paracoccus ravus]|uniref:DUF4422 domain-containing protein n=1 Tax=Paracoccus ravus TaxID=2447760 RepID=UPI00106E66A8|nr:DUF4422 domain-containing protein [Paracoccus ravus]